jgi:hypothetical protein
MSRLLLHKDQEIISLKQKPAFWQRIRSDLIIIGFGIAIAAFSVVQFWTGSPPLHRSGGILLDPDRRQRVKEKLAEAQGG